MFEIGNSLREARLRQNLDFPYLEQATKVRAKYLRALEEEQFDVLPAHTYVKGFLRTYAEFLGLDGQLYVDEYNSRYVAGEEEPPPLRTRRIPTRPHRRFESSVVLAALGGIAVISALVIAAWKFGGSEPQNTPLPSVARATTAATRPAQRPRVVPKPPTTAHLVLTAAHGACWLEVHLGSATGRQVYQGTLEQGRTLPLTAKRLWIDAGAPDALVTRLNGKLVRFPLGIPPGSPSIVTVTPKGIFRAPTA